MKNKDEFKAQLMDSNFRETICFIEESDVNKFTIDTISEQVGKRGP